MIMILRPRSNDTFGPGRFGDKACGEQRGNRAGNEGVM